jgi:hypothetical protein
MEPEAWGPDPDHRGGPGVLFYVIIGFLILGFIFGLFNFFSGGPYRRKWW